MPRAPPLLLTAALVLLPLPGLAIPAQATSTPDASTALLAGHRTVDGLLGWMRTDLADRGCTFRAGDPACSMNAAAWTTLGVAAVAVDPATWPHADRSVLASMLSHPDPFEAASPGAGAATSLSLALLALAAGHVDVRAVPSHDGPPRDLVEDLVALAGPDGNDPEPRDDVWALFAFRAAGHDEAPVPRLVARLLDAQRDDGAWPWARGGRADLDMTAWTLIALSPHHDALDAVADGLRFLSEHQTRQGPQRGCWPAVPGAAPNSVTTAAVLQALAAAGHTPADWSVDGQDPMACLLRHATPTGMFRWVADRDEPAPAAQILPGLAWWPYGAVRDAADWRTPTPPPPAATPDASPWLILVAMFGAAVATPRHRAGR